MTLEINQKPEHLVNKRHKHADLIIAWANGAKIQFAAPEYNYPQNTQQEKAIRWTDIESPTWDLKKSYRIKPKEPVVRYAEIPKPATEGLNSNGFQSFPLQYTSIRTPLDNIKFTFDPDTLKCLSVELIE